MTFEEYWKRRLAATPQMERAATMRIGVEAFRRELQLAYRAGVDETDQRLSEPPQSIMDMFRGIFGGHL